MSNLINLSSVVPSKESLREFAESIKAGVEKESTNPLRMAVLLNFVGKCCVEGLALIKEKTIEEIERHPERKEFMGYKVEVCEAGVTYDYSHCNDPKLEDLYIQMESLKEKVKDREGFLKSLKEPVNVLIEETGELVRLHPPVKRSTTTTKFTLK